MTALDPTGRTPSLHSTVPALHSLKSVTLQCYQPPRRQVLTPPWTVRRGSLLLAQNRRTCVHARRLPFDEAGFQCAGRRLTARRVSPVITIVLADDQNLVRQG